MNSERDFGASVAARLMAGSRDDYELVQKLVIRAQRTQNGTYGDMLMQIVWALLPADAQDSIAEQEPALLEDAALPPNARLRRALRTRLGSETFSAWFQTVRLEEIDAGTVIISVPVKFLRTWIESHYGDELLRCCRVAFGSVERVNVELRPPVRH